MATKGYSGWTLFDEVLIVAKKLGYWDYQEGIWVEEDDWQGYVVDPTNKKMKDSATSWAEIHKSKYDESGKYIGTDIIPGREFLYKNEGFQIELKETAGGSSQGGKLSFWNCWVTAPDGIRFKIGIAADLLLDLLLSSTFEKGKCTEKVFFARQAGGVGMLHKNMESYQQALADMQKKSDVKTKKTSKHKLGYAYSALQEVNAYIADIYFWYKPLRNRHGDIAAYQKLDTPIKKYWFDGLAGYEENKMYKTSSLAESGWKPEKLSLSYHSLRAKLPARIEVGPCIDYDLSIEECIKEYEAGLVAGIEDRHGRNRPYIFTDWELIGMSTSAEAYTMPEVLRQHLIASNIQVID